MTEEWRWIKGYEGTYQISNMGRIKSFLSDKENGHIRSMVNKNGWYFTINLYNKGDRKHSRTLRIHRLVYEAFVGEVPKGFHIHHKDGNKQNNRLDNLELLHPSDHASESASHTNSINKLVEYNTQIKPKRIQQLTMSGVFLAEYANATVAQEFTGVCQRNILQVASKTPYGKNNKTRKQAGGYIWQYANEEIHDAVTV